MKPERWQEIERIFNSALELKPDERGAFLDKACAGDEELRRYVRNLLARHQDAGEFIERPALEMAAEALAADPGSEFGPDLSGSSLSHYCILDKIGVGGMGVVYRAMDDSLGREVAIKVLPEVFAADPERMARFEREARLLASLNHPNIAAIYGIEAAEGKRFLVMELVAGETLAQRLRKGPLPVEYALTVCRQIAEGLEAAHEKGVVHRDLKPANVAITEGDKAKILDFGLAREFGTETAAVDLSKSPTVTEGMTGPGVILGTAAYMSPEQARGKPVDKRADIWAFGCVLYECLTGKRAFHGETVTETIAAVSRGQPDWSLLPAGIPANIHTLLRRCLQKYASQRLRDIGDARIEIGELVSQPVEMTAAPRRRPYPWLVACAVTLFVGLGIGLLVMKYSRPVSVPRISKSIIKVEPGYWLEGMRLGVAEFHRPSRTAMVLSRDGSFIVYSAVAENPGLEAKSQLFLRESDKMQAKPIPGTEGGIAPFLSPDDRWVGFWVEEWVQKGKSYRLKKVSLDGGEPVSFRLFAPMPSGASWSPDETIIFSTHPTSGLSRVTEEGKNPGPLTKPDPQNEEVSHRLPHCLPDGRSVLFTIMRDYWDLNPRTAILNLDTGEIQDLLPDAADARYIPGYLVFLRRGDLMAAQFDLQSLRVLNEPRPVIRNVMQYLNSGNGDYNLGAGQFSISDTGALIYAEGGILPDRQNSLMWVDLKGNAEPAIPGTKPFVGVSLSPDGNRIAYTTYGTNWQVWIYDRVRGTQYNLTQEGRAMTPRWMPDGKRVIYPLTEKGASGIYVQAVDKSSPREKVLTGGIHIGSIRNDGNILAVLAGKTPESEPGIYTYDLQSEKLSPYLNTASSELYPEFSPDGLWLAYTSNPTKRQEVYIKPFPGQGGGETMISVNGGKEPLWARDGKRLFWRWGDASELQVWAVNIDLNQNPPAISAPDLLFKLQGYAMGTTVRFAWDISLDGRKFLMNKNEERKPQPVTEMIFVENWFEEIKSTFGSVTK